jgi:beta-phosphoglucomutase
MDLKLIRPSYKARISGRLNPIIVQDLLPQLSLEAGQQLADNKEARFRDMGLSLTPLADCLTYWDGLILRVEESCRHQRAS